MSAIALARTFGAAIGATIAAPFACPTPNLSLLPTQRPGSTQKTPRSIGSLSAGIIRSLPITRILFATGHNLAGQQDQRPLGVVNQNQLVDLCAIMRHGCSASAHKGLDTPGFSDNHFARVQAFIQGEELRSIEFAGAYNRKDGQISLADGR